MSNTTKVALEDLSAEHEADQLLAEEDERSRDNTKLDRDLTLEDLEASESLPPPVQAIAAVRFLSGFVVRQLKR
ncbi:hypothetical protein P7C70_g7370, partial [Phenoliferia sp. Uapishka_3]